jgi:hypothetical protein
MTSLWPPHDLPIASSSPPDRLRYKPSAERSKKLKLLHELMEDDIPHLIQQLHVVQKRHDARHEARATFTPQRTYRAPRTAHTNGVNNGVHPNGVHTSPPTSRPALSTSSALDASQLARDGGGAAGIAGGWRERKAALTSLHADDCLIAC